MKIDRLDAHDRLLHFKKDQEVNIYQGAEDCLKKNEDALFYQSRSSYIYIFAHPRTADDGVTKRLLWQPRLLKPEAQSNSYLFRAISFSDILEVCWIIPPKELWGQYVKSHLCEHEIASWSIDQLIHNKRGLEAASPDDMSEERAKELLLELIEYKKRGKRTLYESCASSS